MKIKSKDLIKYGALALVVWFVWKSQQPKSGEAVSVIDSN